MLVVGVVAQAREVSEEVMTSDRGAAIHSLTVLCRRVMVTSSEQKSWAVMSVFRLKAAAKSATHSSSLNSTWSVVWMLSARTL